VEALQRQLSLVLSEKDDDRGVFDKDGLAMAGDASPGSHRVRRRTMTSLRSLSSTRSADERASAAEKKPLMTSQLIKDEEIEEGAVGCHQAVYKTLI